MLGRPGDLQHEGELRRVEDRRFRRRLADQLGLKLFERTQERHGTRVALARRLRQRLQDDLAHLRRERVLRHLLRGRRRVVHVRGEHRDCGRRLERHHARHHLVQNDPERVEVRAPVELLGLRLLRAQVLRRAVHHAVLRQLRLVRARRLLDLGDPKVEDLHKLSNAPEVAQHDVVRLEVSVDDAELVGLVQRVERLAHDADGAKLVEVPFALDQPAQRAAFDVLHRHVDQPIFGVTKDEDANDVRVRQLRDRFRLPIEPRDELLALGGVAMQDLDRNLLIDRRVLREIDGAHPAFAQLLGQHVLAEQAGPDQGVARRRGRARPRQLRVPANARSGRLRAGHRRQARPVLRTKLHGVFEARATNRADLHR